MVARILAWVVTELTKAVTTVSILNSDIYLFIYILSFTQDAARSSENTIYLGAAVVVVVVATDELQLLWTYVCYVKEYYTMHYVYILLLIYNNKQKLLLR